MLTAVLDACVLYGDRTRDLLVRLARAGFYRARWTDAIHDEWIRNLKANRPGLDPGKLDRTCALLNAAVEDCLVVGYEGLIPSIVLPDPDDRHVVAAAVRARADLVVTFNLKDFLAEAMRARGLEVVHPSS